MIKPHDEFAMLPVGSIAHFETNPPAKVLLFAHLYTSC